MGVGAADAAEREVGLERRGERRPEEWRVLGPKPPDPASSRRSACKPAVRLEADRAAPTARRRTGTGLKLGLGERLVEWAAEERGASRRLSAVGRRPGLPPLLLRPLLPELLLLPASSKPLPLLIVSPIPIIPVRLTPPAAALLVVASRERARP